MSADTMEMCDGYVCSRAFDQFDGSRHIPAETAFLVAGTERSDVADDYRYRVLSGLLTYWRNDARDDFLARDRSFEQAARARSDGVGDDVIDPDCGNFVRLKYEGDNPARDYLRLLFAGGGRAN